jgi:hypothetical protein
MPRRAYTTFFITVDTHVKSTGPELEREIGFLLLTTIKEFCTPQVLRQVLLVEDVSKLKRARLNNASVETGDKYDRIHAHFNLQLAHETTIYLKAPDGRTINPRVAEWFNGKLEPTTGKKVFVSVRLGNSAAENYAVKSGAAVEDFTVNVRVGSQAVASDKSDS